MAGDRLVLGEELRAGQTLRAGGGQLVLQSDGNFVLYRPGDGRAIWATDTQGKPVTRAQLQRDGNLVMRSPLGYGAPEGRGWWDSGTANRRVTHVQLQPDGNLVWFAGRAVVSSTQTNGWRKSPAWQKDNGGFLASIAHAAGGALSTVGHAVQGVTKTIAPVLDIVSAGVSVLPIPGAASLVAAGLAATAEVGRGHSLADIGLAAARGAIPGGAIVRAGFDLAVGLAKGGSLSSAALNAARKQIPGGVVAQAAFDAGLKIAGGGNVGHVVADAVVAQARNAIPSGPMKAAALRAFDAGVHVAAQARAPAPPEALARARRAIVNPAARAAFDAGLVLAGRTHAPRPAELAAHAATLPKGQRAVFAKAILAHSAAASAPPRVQLRIAEAARSRTRARNISPRAKAWISGAIHRVARPAIAREVRGLDPGGRTYTVERNDSAWRISQNLTGDGNHHVYELLHYNAPPKTLVGSGATLNFKYLKTGEKLKIPPTWKIKGQTPAVPPIAPPAAAPISEPRPAPVADVRPPAAAPNPPLTRDQVVLAGETWRLVFATNRALTAAESATLQAKLVAAMAKANDRASAFEFAGQRGSVVIAYGDSATIYIGRSAAMTVEPGAPIVTLVDAIRLAAVAPVAAGAPTPSAPTVPTGGFTSDDPAAIAQAKAILVAWEHTDGVAAAGLPDYGANPADVSPIWGPRDSLELQAFCGWTNAHGGALPLVGDLTQQKLDALVAWSENKAKAAAPGGASTVSAPVTAPPPTPAAGGTATAIQVIPETSITATPEPAMAGMGDTPWGLLLALGLGGALLLTSKKRVAKKAAG